MHARCNNPKIRGYRWYGARGIVVCGAWQDFEKFYRWAMKNGYEPGLTIDRIDNDGPYSPKNCRWVSRRQNLFNRFEKPLTAFGETKQMIEWAEDPRCVVPFKTLWKRVVTHGWDHERAITQPLSRDTETCSRGHLWSENEVRTDKQRFCRTCHDEGTSSYYQRNREKLKAAARARHAAKKAAVH